MTSIIRPDNNVYFNELDSKFKMVRSFLPDLLSGIHFEGNASAKTLIEALCWIEVNLKKKKTDNDAPREIINKQWQQHVIRKDGSIDFHAYTFCALKELQLALKKRDIYVGVLRRNRRNFRYPSFKPATNVSRSISSLLFWKV